MAASERTEELNKELASKLAALLAASSVEMEGHTDDEGVRISFSVPKNQPGTFRQAGRASQELMALIIERNL